MNYNEKSGQDRGEKPARPDAGYITGDGSRAFADSFSGKQEQ